MKKAIIIFIKNPEPGNVKTRLAKDISSYKAAMLYRCFVEDIISSLCNIDADILIFHNTDDQDTFVEWLGAKYSFFYQKGEDLGEKMKNAFLKTFEIGYTETIIIGSDTPEISMEIIAEGFNMFTGFDAVIGPARDGGYYLLGFKKSSFLNDVFENIHWSSSTVFKETISILETKKIPVFTLVELNDIDNIDDIEYLLSTTINTPDRCPKTIDFISKELK